APAASSTVAAVFGSDVTVLTGVIEALGWGFSMRHDQPCSSVVSTNSVGCGGQGVQSPSSTEVSVSTVMMRNSTGSLVCASQRMMVIAAGLLSGPTVGWPLLAPPVLSLTYWVPRPTCRGPTRRCRCPDRLTGAHPASRICRPAYGLWINSTSTGDPSSLSSQPVLA